MLRQTIFRQAMSLHTVHSTCFKRYCPPFFPLFSTICLRFFSYLFPVIPPFSSIFHLLSTIFLPFLSFFSYLFPVIPPFSSIFSLFSTIFLRFFPTFFLIFPLFSTIFLHFSWVFSSLFPAGINGPRGNRSLSSPLCVVVHAPPKSSMCPPSTATNFEILAPYATTTPPQTP